MGIAKGKVSSYAEKNLNAKQQKLLNSTMFARIQKVIDSVPEISTVIKNLKILIKPVLEEAGIKNMGKNDALDHSLDVYR